MGVVHGILGGLLGATGGPCHVEPPPVFEVSERRLAWSGLELELRESELATGAGANRWTAAEEAVWAEGDALHLRLEPEGDHGGRSVEARATLSRRPRSLRFTTTLPEGMASDDVVAAVFLYRSDRCEVDLELSRWGVSGAPLAQYAVAPAQTPEQVHRFELDPEEPAIHELRWRRGRLTWTTAVGGQEVARWTRRVGPWRGHQLHLSLWLLPDASLEEPVELVVSGLGI